MRDRSIAIIGAGVAGLAAGCYAQMNGYRTRIFEMHGLPGGVCTSWRRDGYIFDGCLQWLMGSRPGSPLNRTWQELGALTGRDVVDHDEFLRIEGRDGTDAGRLRRRRSPGAPPARAGAGGCGSQPRTLRGHPSVRGARSGRSSAHGIAGRRTGSPLASDRSRPSRPWSGWLGSTWQELAARFTDRFVRDAIRSSAMYRIPRAARPHAAHLDARPLTPATRSAARSRSPRPIEQRYRDLGGQISYGARVEKILVEDRRAVGVRLADGTEPAPTMSSRRRTGTRRSSACSRAGTPVL